MNLDDKITGVIESTDGPILFVRDGFRFLFMTDKIEDVFSEKRTTLISDSNGYLHGHTHQGRLIYIYANKDLKLQSKLYFQTTHYFLVDKDLDEFDFTAFRGIRAENGTLHKIFQPTATLMKKTDDGLNVKIVD